MIKILLGAGHLNIKYNSITSLHGNTGTSGELEINVRITNRLASVLRDKGFEVTQTDANANDDKTITSKDFNLALFLHCDMDTANDNGGGMIGSGDKSVDASWVESKRIKDVMDSIYFKETGIVNKNFVTEGMTKYYIWQYLSPKTSCVLIEMGQAMDAHDKVLLANTDLIANAIAKAICKAFNVTYDSTPTIPIVSCEEKLLNVTKELTNLKIYTENLDDKVKEMGLVIAENKETISTITKELKVLNNGTQTLLENIEYYKPFKTLYENALNTQINKYDGWELIKIGINKLIKKEN
jgi:hypothetical protein